MNSYLKSGPMLALSATVLLSGAAGTFADTAPTTEEMRQLFTDAKYKELLPKLTRALAAKGPDAAQYDKYDLLLMKGEVSLRMHSKSQAADAFTQAAKATEKPDDIAVASATATLIKASSGGLKYTPHPRSDKADKNDKPDPIDIVEPDSRKHAFDALEKDMAAARQPKVEAAVKGNSLDAILAAAKDLADLKPIEIAASGSPADTKQMMGDLGGRSSKLVTEATENLGKQLNAEVESYNASVTPHKAGTPNQSGPHVSISSLKHDAVATVATVKQLQDQTKQLTAIFGDVADFKIFNQQSKSLLKNAENMVAQITKAGG